MSDVENYGPLQNLIGVWVGNSGMDISPEPDGTEKNPYYERVEYTPAGDVTNAESQQVMAIRYYQTVNRIGDDKVIHDQLGYWMWDRERELVMHSLLIPRGVAVLAAGGYSVDGEGVASIRVQATAGSDSFGIVQSPFMKEKALTKAFTMELVLGADSLFYKQSILLDIYGREFDHTDESRLIRQA